MDKSTSPAPTVMGALTTCLITAFSSITNLFQAVGNTSSAGAHVTAAWDHTAESYEDKALHNRNLFRLENEEEYSITAAKLTAAKPKAKAKK